MLTCGNPSDATAHFSKGKFISEWFQVALSRTNITQTDYTMMVAFSCSSLCSTSAIFQLKDNTISQLFFSGIVYGTFLEDSQSKPIFQDCTTLYSCPQYQLDVPFTLLLMQDVPASCFPASPPLKPLRKQTIFFFFFIPRRCQNTSNSNR